MFNQIKIKQKPIMAQNSFVAPSASVIGNVMLQENSSIWYGAVLRADGEHKITVGSFSNVQDRAVITSAESAVTIGSHVTIGHGALLASCVVGSEVLIGQGAIVQEGAVISSKCIVAAGAVVLPGANVPSGQLWGGNPAKFIRDISADEGRAFAKQAASYANLGHEHAFEFPSTSSSSSSSSSCASTSSTSHSHSHASSPSTAAAV